VNDRDRGDDREGGRTEPGPSELPETIVDELLADRRRRFALACLLGRASPVSLAALADCVTEREVGGPPDAVPETRLRVYMSLYHDHRPVLVNAGVLEYCQDEDTVTLTAAAETLASRLEPVEAEPKDCDR